MLYVGSKRLLGPTIERIFCPTVTSPGADPGMKHRGMRSLLFWSYIRSLAQSQKRTLPVLKQESSHSPSKRLYSLKQNVILSERALLAWDIARLRMSPGRKSDCLISSRRRPTVTIGRYFGRAAKLPTSLGNMFST